MTIYVFGADRQLLGVVESYEYLRWTRRYSHSGDFEMLAAADKNSLDLLKMGHILWKYGDDEAGFIEHIEQTMEEREKILVRGRFATSVLGRRIVWGTEMLQGDISAVMSQLLTRHLISPSAQARKIAGISFAADDFGIGINTQVSYKNLLETAEGLCDTADIGIKTVWNPAARDFTVTLYRGADSQAVFSKEYENITSQTYIHSELNCAEIALVAGEGEGASRQIVTVGGGSGIDRREVFVDAKDLRQEDFGAGYTAALTQRGQAKLAEQTAVRSFDAAINPHGNLVYKTDFDIGQTVRVVSQKWGVTLTARITEIEESYDQDGLTLNVVFGRGLLTLAQKLRGGI